jgi:hypothetical protein
MLKKGEARGDRRIALTAFDPVFGRVDDWRLHMLSRGAENAPPSHREVFLRLSNKGTGK